MKSLKDTIGLMVGDNYKERFIAEFAQTQIRYSRLNAMVTKYKLGTLSFAPTCPIELLELQLRSMRDYLTVLEARAAIEHIDISTYKGE